LAKIESVSLMRCYLQVWSAEQHLGISEFINGPRDYPSLRRLPRAAAVGYQPSGVAPTRRYADRVAARELPRIRVCRDGA
jgi:hypothetical protein